MSRTSSDSPSTTTFEDAYDDAKKISSRLSEFVDRLRAVLPADRLFALRAKINDFSFPGPDHLTPKELGALRHIENHLTERVMIGVPRSASAS
jgi:hypothetical protein